MYAVQVLKPKVLVISIILVEDRDIHICPHLLVRLLLFSGRCWAWRCFKKDATQRHQFRLCAQIRREWATYFISPRENPNLLSSLQSYE